MASSAPSVGLGVDPSAVPTQKLSTGATMPAIGLGTFGSDQSTLR